MTIFIFGNEDLDFDALPLKILPKLRKRFAKIDFVTQDPNEEWEIPDDLVVIDTVMGIKDIQVFDDLKYFEKSPQVSMHDWDALTNLLFLKKLGKIKKIKIIGVPEELSEKQALKEIEKNLTTLMSTS